MRLARQIVLEALKGKGLGRTLMNETLSEFELSGDILDLGAGSDSASYNRFLKFKRPFRVTYSDYYKTGPNLVRIDLEQPFGVASGAYDFVLCFNVLEHVYDFRNLIGESYRVLRPGGVFIGCTPFMQRFHPDPNDYFRYTHEALCRMFAEAGYECDTMLSLGFGPFSAAVSQWASLVPRVLRPGLFLGHIVLDMMVSRLSPHWRMKHPLGYVYTFRKQ